MKNLIDLTENSLYILVNKKIIKEIGLNEAIMLGELCSEYTYWEKKDKLEDGYFYSTRENIKENTMLSFHQQREAIKNLMEKELILMNVTGLPRKCWYSINIRKLGKFFE